MLLFHEPHVSRHRERHRIGSISSVHTLSNSDAIKYRASRCITAYLLGAATFIPLIVDCCAKQVSVIVAAAIETLVFRARLPVGCLLMRDAAVLASSFVVVIRRLYSIGRTPECKDLGDNLYYPQHFMM